METTYQTGYIRRNITINDLRHFILDNGITENDTILMHPSDFEKINKEHFQTYEIKLPHFFFLLQVLIRKDNDLKIQSSVVVIKDDTSVSRQQCIDQHREEENKIVHRCWYCGAILSSEGEELPKHVYIKEKEFLERMGRFAKTEIVDSFCCEPYYKNVERKHMPDFVTFHGIDYSVIADIPLMELTQEDFKKIRIDMGTNPEYEVLYHCPNDSFTKLYLTPNDNCYSVRTYYLKEREKIYTTAALIEIAKDHRRYKYVPTPA